jgi:hypothetical protein
VACVGFLPVTRLLSPTVEPLKRVGRQRKRSGWFIIVGRGETDTVWTRLVGCLLGEHSIPADRARCLAAFILEQWVPSAELPLASLSDGLVTLSF